MHGRVFFFSRGKPLYTLSGLSDPFVVVELLPTRLFNSAEQTTNVQKNTLNPNFEECFEL